MVKHQEEFKQLYKSFTDAVKHSAITFEGVKVEEKQRIGNRIRNLSKVMHLELFGQTKKGICESRGIKYNSNTPLTDILNDEELQQLVYLMEGVIVMIYEGYNYQEVKEEIAMYYRV